ncbi:unnamed protein product [Boreogadus saida]
MPCIAHILQRSITKQEPLVQDVPTRWNLTVDMVKRLNRNQAAVKATLDQQQHKLIMLTPPEWDKVQRLETLLEPCRYVTEILVCLSNWLKEE